MTLFDQRGVAVSDWVGTNHHMKIDIGNLKNGVYLLRVSSKSGVSMVKLVLLKNDIQN